MRGLVLENVLHGLAQDRPVDGLVHRLLELAIKNGSAQVRLRSKDRPEILKQAVRSYEDPKAAHTGTSQEAQEGRLCNSTLQGIKEQPVNKLEQADLPVVVDYGGDCSDTWLQSG